MAQANHAYITPFHNFSTPALADLLGDVVADLVTGLRREQQGKSCTQYHSRTENGECSEDVARRGGPRL